VTIHAEMPLHLAAQYF